MQWSDFVAEVNAQLAVEANRRGMEAYRDRFIRNAVLDLQRYIPGFRQGLTTTYAKADVTALDKCSLVTLPTGAKPKELWQYSTDPNDDQYCVRHRLDFYPWESRQDLVCGSLNFATWWNGCSWPVGNCPPTPPADCDWSWCQRKGYVYTIGPHGKNFLVYPAINDKTALLLLWDGYKTEFVGTDTIPFSDGTAEAAAAYLKWKITLDVDKNPVLSREHLAFWRERRLSLYRDWQDTQDAEGKGDEYDGQTTPPPANLSNFGAESVPFLAGVTMLAGVTNAALANIATVNISTPFMVMINIGGAVQLWQLTASNAATGVGAQRGNDYNAATNAKVWFQLS